MTVVFLVRHAAHVELGKRLTGRKSNVGLSEAGERQLLALKKRMGGEALSAVYSSPRIRARLTAAAIAEPHGLEVQVAPELDEIDFGEWTGATFEELSGDAAWRHWNEARGTGCPPGGEPMQAASARIVAHIGRVAEEKEDGAVAMVSHCDMIRGAIAHYLGLPLDNLLHFDIDPGSVSSLEVGSWGARVTSLNEKAPV